MCPTHGGPDLSGLPTPAKLHIPIADLDAMAELPTDGGDPNNKTPPSGINHPPT